MEIEIFDSLSANSQTRVGSIIWFRRVVKPAQHRASAKLGSKVKVIVERRGKRCIVTVRLESKKFLSTSRDQRVRQHLDAFGSIQ